MGIQVATALLTRRRLGDWLPWLVVLLVGCMVEIADVEAEWWHSLGLQIAKSAHDLVNTMVLPTVLLIASRRRPTLFGRT